MLVKSEISAEDILKKIRTEILKETPFFYEGKLIRSKIGLLLLFACDANPNENHVNILLAGELIHCASLLHDDVIDEDNTRRNAPSFRVVHNNKTSILEGNKLLTKAIELLLKTGSVNAINIFNKTISNMCDGELIQIKQKNTIPSLEEYTEKSRLKTGSLFEGIIHALSELPDSVISSKMSDFGKYFGIAFQIKNDLDNILTTKTDIKNGIYTAPVIFSGSINITDDSIEKTYGLIDNYTRKAIETITDLRESEYKKSLIEVTECLLKR